MRKAIVMAVVLALSGLFPAGCAVSNTDQLTATTWYLVSGTEKNPAWQWSVPTDAQDRYTIRFEEDGTFSSRADCNQLSGSWNASGSDRVTITPGPMTMAFCGELSFDVLYAGLLGQVRNWNVASTGMTLTLADGGLLDYTSVAPPGASPDAETTTEPSAAPTTPAPTVTATVTATPAPSTTTTRPSPGPTTTVTATATATATATVTAKPTSTPTPGPGLTSRAWQLTAFSLKVPAFEGTVPPDQQSRYTIQFRADGTFTAQADCNTVNGTYSPANPSDSRGNLSLTPGAITIVACGEGSYSDLYITGFANTASFALTGEGLALTLVDAGTLVYR